MEVFYILDATKKHNGEVSFWTWTGVVWFTLERSCISVRLVIRA